MRSLRPLIDTSDREVSLVSCLSTYNQIKATIQDQECQAASSMKMRLFGRYKTLFLLFCLTRSNSNPSKTHQFILQCRHPYVGPVVYFKNPDDYFESIGLTRSTKISNTTSELAAGTTPKASDETKLLVHILNCNFAL